MTDPLFTKSVSSDNGEYNNKDDKEFHLWAMKQI